MLESADDEDESSDNEDEDCDLSEADLEARTGRAVAGASAGDGVLAGIPGRSILYFPSSMILCSVFCLSIFFSGNFV